MVSSQLSPLSRTLPPSYTRYVRATLARRCRFTGLVQPTDCLASPRFVSVLPASEFPSILWVRHDEYIAAHLLPTFSSLTIQFSMARLLPRLSDPFILVSHSVRKNESLRP